MLKVGDKVKFQTGKRDKKLNTWAYVYSEGTILSRRKVPNQDRYYVKILSDIATKSGNIKVLTRYEDKTVKIENTEEVLNNNDI